MHRDLADGVDAGQRALSALRFGDALQKRPQRRSMPGVATPGSVELIDEPFDQTHRSKVYQRAIPGGINFEAIWK